jgi:hypothetical protein
MPYLCSTVAGMVMLKGSMSIEGETLQVSALPYRCSTCPFCCACLGYCTAKFGGSRGTYELPCISHTKISMLQRIIYSWVISMSSEPNFQHFWTWPSRIFFKFGSSHVSPQIVKNLNFQIFINCTFQVTVNLKQQKSSFLVHVQLKKIYYYS